MYIKVVIDMQNKNALIAMANVSQNAGNPFFAFEEYIKYCMFINPKNELTFKEIENSIEQEFGLKLPKNIITRCLNDLVKEKIISIEEHQFKKVGSFDVERFDEIRVKYRETESKLIYSLIEYAKSYNRIWNYDKARELLIKVLDRNGLAFDIFTQKHTVKSNIESLMPFHQTQELLLDDDESLLFDSPDNSSSSTDKIPLFDDVYFVGRFIDKIIEGDSIYKDYLVKICAGLMICVGTYQLPGTNSTNSAAIIKGTSFFFDTRLLLRYLGCAGEAAVESAKELVNLIQSLGGNIYYYPQTLEEMNRSFEKAIKLVQKGYPPTDYEMLLYFQSINKSIAVLTAKKASLEKELASSHIYLRKLNQYNESDHLKFGFDLSSLKKYMYSKLFWDTKAIDNDALSIWETHMRREGNYNEYCGTNNRIPVFVTNNSRLISIALGFRSERCISNISNWNPNRLPVITDVRLTCRLWSPATNCERFSLLYLTANAVAAQKPTQLYYNRIIELADEYEKNVPEYSNICLTEYFDDIVTEEILKETQGNEKNLDAGTFANSIAEIQTLKALEVEREANKKFEKVCLEKNTAISERNKKEQELNNQSQGIIEAAVERNKNKLGWRKIVLAIIKWSPLLFVIILAIISSLISSFCGSWNYMAIAGIGAFLALVEYFLVSDSLVKKLLKKIFPKIKNSYIKKIKKNLSNVELPFQEEIINKSIEQTEYIIKVKDKISEQ